jgi:hypothetical protein
MGLINTGHHVAETRFLPFANRIPTSCCLPIEFGSVVSLTPLHTFRWYSIESQDVRDLKAKGDRWWIDFNGKVHSRFAHHGVLEEQFGNQVRLVNAAGQT